MLKDVKKPHDLDVICQDIKLCGRRELSELLKLRFKLNQDIEKKAKAIKDAKYAQEHPENEEKTEEQLQAEVDKELEEAIKRLEKTKKKQLKKEREREAK